MGLMSEQPVAPQIAPTGQHWPRQQTPRHEIPPQLSSAKQLPFLQVAPFGQPQSSMRSHPSPKVPHTPGKSEQLFSWHPHWFASPRPSQVSGAVQVPHERVAPQPSETAPHSAPRSAQVLASQGSGPQTFGAPPPPQTSIPAQVPQLRVPPQPSGIVPHSAPTDAQVVGVHPHSLSTPSPPQTSGGEQLPHVTSPPQPSGAVPHWIPSSAQVPGVHPHTFASPPPPQVSGAAHVPHSRVSPQPSEMTPQSTPTLPQLLTSHVPSPQRFGSPWAPQV